MAAIGDLCGMAKRISNLVEMLHPYTCEAAAQELRPSFLTDSSVKVHGTAPKRVEV